MRNILVVEDNSLSRRNITLFLRAPDTKIYEAATGEAALEMLGETTFEIVIADLRLPGLISGIDILRHHFRSAPQHQRILITAFASSEIRTEAEKIKAYFY